MGNVVNDSNENSDKMTPSVFVFVSIDVVNTGWVSFHGVLIVENHGSETTISHTGRWCSISYPYNILLFIVYKQEIHNIIVVLLIIIIIINIQQYNTHGANKRIHNRLTNTV